MYDALCTCTYKIIIFLLNNCVPQLFLRQDQTLHMYKTTTNHFVNFYLHLVRNHYLVTVTLQRYHHEKSQVILNHSDRQSQDTKYMCLVKNVLLIQVGAVVSETLSENLSKIPRHGLKTDHLTKSLT